MNKTNSGLKIGAVVLISLIVIGNLATFFPTSKDKAYRPSVAPTPIFQREGRLTFLTRTDTAQTSIISIDIEIADNNATRAQGLMNRRSMQPTQGMLFIFPREKEQSFWMKNTYISLDILYVDENYNIVKIYRRTTPLSTVSLPSEKEAKYVVEVNGGFCTQHRINEGDMISFERFD